VTEHDRIRRVLARYCHYCDEGRFDLWSDLFTEGATFTVLGRTYEGRDNLRGFIADAQPPERRGRHVISEPVIELDGDGARAWTDYVFVGRVGETFGITSVGRYHDRLVREGDDWRIASREIIFMGEQPATELL
jgi:3-phenylpropionate/cinnamic acid dioxygenase small subunit